MEITGAVLEEIGRARPFAASRPITVETLELDPPGPGEVLVAVECAGLCHSDLSVVDGNRVRPVPMLLGHEAAGTVAELGSGVGGLSVGDRVVTTFLPRCGACEACAGDGTRPCVPGSAANGAGTLLSGARRLHRAGGDVHHHLGVSAFATHAVIDARSLVRVDQDVPPEVAAVMGCAVLTGGGAVVNVGRPVPGDTVVVVGLGGVGMAAVLTALAHEDVTVVAVDPVADKLRTALELGAHRALSADDSVAAGVKARVVVEAAGNVHALRTALDLTGPGGTTITVGLPSPDARIELSPTALVAEGRSLVGSYLGSAVPGRDIPRFVELWRAGRLPVEQLVSSRIPLADINAGMDRLAEGTTLRQIITMSGL
ncbi:alcohol dehydrogenase catalytic domain-containing protein [Nocardioides sp. cx-169]|uniref:alcohol dehydrogenase catalytic domain-containing protein n=1 Tax=Nocardioides sp. cx-169 TaxID=2899080 RepID=UPI001E2A5B77|nr:alcohol dehydrogenase catalytic domain-containing protein [Nocardioides sp. cx-169]MCD4534276.1 alcohol dehydrogenase catalytic domain-containing protein [Nocardioides sp. cx-169]